MKFWKRDESYYLDSTLRVTAKVLERRGKAAARGLMLPPLPLGSYEFKYCAGKNHEREGFLLTMHDGVGGFSDFLAFPGEAGIEVCLLSIGCSERFRDYYSLGNIHLCRLVIPNLGGVDCQAGSVPLDSLGKLIALFEPFFSPHLGILDAVLAAEAMGELCQQSIPILFKQKPAFTFPTWN